MPQQRRTVKVALSSIDGSVQAIFDKLEKRMKEKGDYCYASRHEAYGLIAEEFEELMWALHENNPENFEEELIDIAIGCIWGLASSYTWKIHGNLNIKDES